MLSWSSLAFYRKRVTDVVHRSNNSGSSVELNKGWQLPRLAGKNVEQAVVNSIIKRIKHNYGI